MHFLREESDKNIPLSRPGTSSGQRRLSQASLTSFLGPDTVNSSTINANLVKETFDREVETDNLLRIMRRDEIESQNELFILAEQGDYKKFKDTIDHIDSNIDISVFRGLHGYTLLHHACSRGHSSIVLELLKNNRDSVHLRNDIHETPLHLAAYHGHLLLVDLLLDYKAEINAVNKEGETCLFYAARRNMPAVIRLLIQRGINTEIKDSYGDVALDQATHPSATLAFQTVLQKPSSPSSSSNPFHQDNLFVVYSYLHLNEVLRCACVCRKWHLVSSSETLWKERGVRRWELVLQSSLGFAPTTTMSFMWRSNSKHRDRGVRSGGSGTNSVSISRQGSIVLSNNEGIL